MRLSPGWIHPSCTDQYNTTTANVCHKAYRWRNWTRTLNVSSLGGRTSRAHDGKFHRTVRFMLLILVFLQISCRICRDDFLCFRGGENSVLDFRVNILLYYCILLLLLYIEFLKFNILYLCIASINFCKISMYLFFVMHRPEDGHKSCRNVLGGIQCV
jgi:hypothetical protein